MAFSLHFVSKTEWVKSTHHIWEEKLYCIQQILIEFLHVSGQGLGIGYEVVCREDGNMNALHVFLNPTLQDLTTPTSMTARPSPRNRPLSDL